MREDVAGALGAGEQILAVVGVEEFAERLDAADDHQEIVLAAEREHGVDEVVSRALLAELDLQAIGEEGEKIELGRASVWNSCAATPFSQAAPFRGYSQF